VYAFATRRLSAAHIAEEVTNDTFIQVWRSASSFEQRSSGKTWLLGIAKHKVMEAMRTHYRIADNEQPEPDGDHHQAADPAPGPYEQVLSRQKGTHLAECFEALSPDHRECLHLSIVEGMTLNEIAKVVDAPSNTVGTRIHHAKHKLKACLESRLGAGEVV
jgi:RNA polymerase sigma-70 factor (ECF subfamily)